MTSIPDCQVRPNPPNAFRDLLIGTGTVIVVVEILIRSIRASTISKVYTGEPPKPPFSLPSTLRLNPNLPSKDIMRLTGLNVQQSDQLKAYLVEEKEFKERKAKFDEIVAKCIIRGFHTFWGLAAVIQTPCFQSDGSDSFISCFADNLTTTQEWVVNRYYYLMLGWYGYRAIHQFFDAHVRSDFWIMFTHHWTTIALLSGSFFSGYIQIGCLVGACHDMADFQIAFTKIATYLKFKPWDAFLGAFFCFCWIAVRTVIFPYCVIYQRIIFADGCHKCLTENYTNDKRAWDPYIFGGLLTVLWLLHVYWIKFIIQYVKHAISGKKNFDPRSGKED